MADTKNGKPLLHLYRVEYTRRWERKKLHGSSDSSIRTKRGKPISESKTVLARDEERAREIITRYAKQQRFSGKSPLELGRTYNVLVSITSIKEIY